jgi:hypothetical protein
VSQVLSMLASTRIQWPRIIYQLYQYLSIFNFNINLTAPECTFTFVSVLESLEPVSVWVC